MRVEGDKMKNCKVIGKSLKKSLMMGGLCVLMLCGCSSKEKEQCEENVSAILEAYQSKDETCGKYLSGNEKDANVEFEGFQSVLADPITFEIKSVEVNKEYSIVNVVITNVDFEAVFEGLVNDDLKVDSTESIALELEKRLQADDAPMREFEVPVKLNEEQKIEMSSELSNALLGGYAQYIYELTEGDVQ